MSIVIKHSRDCELQVKHLLKNPFGAAIMVRLTRTQISLSEGTPEDICVLVTNNPYDDGEIFTLSLSESKGA